MPGLSSSFPQYAPESDLEAYLGRLLDDKTSDRYLQRASGVISDFTVTARYRVNEDGFTPTDERIRNAFHDATILQAAAYVEAGVTPTEVVASGKATIQSKSLGARSVTYAPNAAADAQRAALLSGAIAPEALSVLSRNGLTGAGVNVGGGSSYDILLRRWV